MNRFVKTALSTGAAVALAATARAQYAPGDLVIGFNGGAANDVLFDLGPGTSLPTVGSVSYTSFLSPSLLGANDYASLSGRFVGVIGARPTPGGTSGNQGIWSTTTPGMPAPATLANQSSFNAAKLSVDSTGGLIDGTGSPANSFVVDKTDPNSWNQNVKNGGINTFVSNYGDPNVQFSGSSISMDLWYEKWQDGSSAGPVKLGTFTLDNTYALTFAAIPEPSTYGLLIGGSALLFLGRRWKLNLRKA